MNAKSMWAIYFLIYFLVYLEEDGKFEIEIWIWNWIWVQFVLDMEFLKYFFLKCLGTSCYLTVVSGGFFFSDKDTRRCFLRCLQVSSNSSILFNIVFWSAIRIISFSVRHRSHALPSLENACPLALIDQFTKWGIFLSFNFQMDILTWGTGVSATVKSLWQDLMLPSINPKYLKSIYVPK